MYHLMHQWFYVKSTEGTFTFCWLAGWYSTALCFVVKYQLIQCSHLPSATNHAKLMVITNHATDAIKAIVHTVNMKFRKLKKNNVRNTNKTGQLKQEMLELLSLGIHAGV